MPHSSPIRHTEGLRGLMRAPHRTPSTGPLRVFDPMEPEVRSDCRAFPVVFASARGAVLRDEEGREYLDFFSGAGTLNYGHNPPALTARVAEYLAGDGIVHALDMAAAARRAFLQRFHDVVLQPRGMDYRVQFPGPTGTSAVEAARKLARKATGRRTVAFFANAYHGMTPGALAVTGNASRRRGARGLVVETAGPRDEVLKVLPPLTIHRAELDDGLHRIAAALDAVPQAAEPAPAEAAWA
jgi:diaminobutyrate-2-oxoglutarate transaminase